MIPRYLELSSYQKRREKLFSAIEPSSDLVLMFNAPEKMRNFDREFAFRSDSSFYYLTGFPEPNSALMMWKEAGSKSSKKASKNFHLFTAERNAAMEQWTGRRYGPRGAEKSFGADKGHVFAELEAQVLKFMSSRPRGTRVRILTNAQFSGEARIGAQQQAFFQELIAKCQGALRRGGAQVNRVEDVGLYIQAQRLVKAKDEIEIMKTSAQICVDGHLEALEALRPGAYEYELQAAIEGEFLRQGASGAAYNSIVASGENATILHYGSNNRKMKDGDLVLIDAGCEYQFYASDITRTFPVGGTYTKAQRNIMDIVAEAHHEAIRVAKPGVRYEKIHETSTRVLVEGLRSLKLLKGSTAQILKDASHKKYFPHGTGHWLGLDVHDECPYLDGSAKSIKLEQGQVFTVEPGLYFRSNDRSVPAEYRGIGVRIEDDVLVGKKGPEILTKGLPRYAEEIEAHLKNL